MSTPITGREYPLVQSFWEALAHPAVRKWVESMGMTLGPFVPRGNINRFLSQKKLEQIHNEIMQEATSDEPAFLSAARGFSHLLGVEWTEPKGQQLQDIQDLFSEAAPILMRTAPEFYDMATGGTGLPSIAMALADINRYNNVPTDKLMEQAKEVHKRLTEDPSLSHGFSNHELGKILLRGAEKGYLPVTDDTEELTSGIEPVTRSLAAIRDMQGQNLQRQAAETGHSEIDLAFNELDKHISAYGGPGVTMDDIATNLYGSKHLQSAGGAWSQGWQSLGKKPPSGVGPQTANAMHRKLVEQAGKSPAAALIGGAKRLRESGHLEEGSLGDMIARIDDPEVLNELEESGKIDEVAKALRTPHQWVDLMAESGVPRDLAADVTTHHTVNQDYATSPGVAQSVRTLQYAIDIQDKMKSIEDFYKGREHPELAIQGAKARLAKSFGLNSRQFEALHDKELMSGLRDTYQRAHQKARQDISHAHVGRQGPGQRLMEGLKYDPKKGQKPPTLLGLAGRLFGGIPRDQFPSSTSQIGSKQIQPSKPIGVVKPQNPQPSKPKQTAPKLQQP